MINKDKETTAQGKYQQVQEALEQLKANPVMALLAMVPADLERLVQVTRALPEEQRRLDTRIDEAGKTLEQLESDIVEREERLAALDLAVDAARRELAIAAGGGEM